MLEQWTKCAGREKVFGALLTDLSKTFDFLDHKLLTAKLNAYSLTICQIEKKEQKLNILIALGNCIWSYTHLNIGNTIIQY